MMLSRRLLILAATAMALASTGAFSPSRPLQIRQLPKANQLPPLDAAAAQYAGQAISLFNNMVRWNISSFSFVLKFE